jgi:aspartate aminotransferase
MNHSPQRFASRMERMAESATAAVFRKVAELKAQGVDIVSLAVGEPDSEPPAVVRDAVQKAADRGRIRYTEVAGLRSLRQAICDDSERRRGVRHEPGQVVVSAGAKHALFNLAQVLFQDGDEVVIPVPAWGSYAEQARLCGATPVLLPCAMSDGFLVQAGALESALGPRTKAVVLCTPSNPTGAAYSGAQLAALAEVLRKSRAYVIVDEIYSTLCHDGFVFESLLSLAPDLGDRLVIVDGVSKRFAMTGYRVGWMLAPHPVARACEAVQSQATTSVSGLSQLAAEAVLREPGGFTETMQAELQRRRDVLFDALVAIPGVEVHKPQAAFYLFAGVHELIRRAGLQGDVELSGVLLEQAGVAVVPGSAFHAEGFLRLSYATSVEQLERAAGAIARVFGALATS